MGAVGVPRPDGTGAAALDVFLELGRTPLADRLLRQEELAAAEPTVPLSVALFAFARAAPVIDSRVGIVRDLLERRPEYSEFRGQPTG